MRPDIRLHLMVALQCGYPSRRLLYDELTYEELREIEVAFAQEPWGEGRADLRAGIVAAAAVSPYARRGHTPKPIDFMPYAQRQLAGKPKQDEETMKKIAEQAAAGFRKRAELVAKMKAEEHKRQMMELGPVKDIE